MCRFGLLFGVAALAGLGGAHASLAAQDPRYTTGRWDADSFGNHRVVVRVTRPAEAVRVHLSWRRRDSEPEKREVLVIDGQTGQRVTNVARLRITRESGDLVFQASHGGLYYFYYLPYTGTIRSNYPKITYPPPAATADTGWLHRHELTVPPADWQQRHRLPVAQVVEFQSVDEFNNVYPMEVIATAAETRQLIDQHGRAGYLVFPEDRRFPIRMTRDLPQRWIQRGAAASFDASAMRGEFYVFQLGVFAARHRLEDVKVSFTGLAPAAAGDRIPPDAFRCFNLGGVDWEGRPFVTPVSVDSGRVQPIWCGVQVPVSAHAGRYTGSATVSAKDAPATMIALRFQVAADTIRHAGDDEPWRLTRLRWLDSRLDVDDGLVPPYTAVEVSGDTIGVLGRRLVLGSDGLPISIKSFFDIEMTRIGSQSREMLTGPVRLVAERAGAPLAWSPGGVKLTRRGEGAVEWEAENVAGPLAMKLNGRAEFDGHLQFTVSIRATEAVDLDDIRLEIPFTGDVARYAMGLGLKGGVRPDTFAWKWDVTKNHDAAWIGDVNAGLQFSLRDDRYRRPLNTNFYQLQPLIMPASWDNGGKGGCRFGPGSGSTYLVRCYSGARHMAAGEVQRYDFILLLTPFKTLDTKGQWSTRYFHAYAPLDSVAKMGANTINVHHATAINPWINYPFLRPDTMRAYIDAAHRRGMRVKIYYTVRELTDHAPEIFALQSLDHEIFSSGAGGGFSWLQEHLDGDYIAAWHVPEIKDAAIVNTGISRWHNFYVEGLHWLVENVGIDGLYIDDVAFDRTTMKRVRKVLDRGRPDALIDLHSANQYNVRDGFVNSANLYLEHFPYINRLWFGEYFDYNGPPDFWLVEMSGIPFGLMGEMLQDGGNPWRGQVFGMTNRLPWSGDPRALWKAWDDFGIQQSRMIGFWVPDNPVKTTRPDILATSFVRDGKTMVALASWAKDTAQVALTIDWSRLGIDPARARISAAAIPGFQEAIEFPAGAAIPVAPGRGWLLVLEGRR